LIALVLIAVVTAVTWLPANPASWFAARETGEPAPASASGACPAGSPMANMNFTLKDMHGHDVKLSDFKGKVVLIDFWATWCRPCRYEIPGFVELQDKYRDKGLEILGVSINDAPEELPPFAREFKMNYKVLVGLDRQDLFEAFGPLMGVPTTVVIGRDGRICGREVGLTSKEEFERVIKGLL
jgi:peroxiredoxin